MTQPDGSQAFDEQRLDSQGAGIAFASDGQQSGDNLLHGGRLDRGHAVFAQRQQREHGGFTDALVTLG